MPIYEYRCTLCQHVFDTLQKIQDAPLSICPNCGKNSLEKLVSAPIVHFKGSGWYKTDYAPKAAEAPAPAKSSEKSSPPQSPKPSGNSEKSSQNHQEK